MNQAPTLADQAAQILAAAGRKPTMPIEFRSQAGEDVLVWELLGRPLDGFYIEVGAFNGRDFAVTYALDAMGWNGLLIEAIPERYQECVKNRPNARVVHAALGPPGQKPTTTMTVTDDEHGGMLSHVGSTVMQAGNVIRGSRKVEVPFTTMDTLLKEHQGGVDLAVIDVEGFEVPLLQGFNLKKYRPKLLLLEDSEDPQAKGGTRVFRYMRQCGYYLVAGLANNKAFVRGDLLNEVAPRVQAGRL